MFEERAPELAIDGGNGAPGIDVDSYGRTGRRSGLASAALRKQITSEQGGRGTSHPRIGGLLQEATSGGGKSFHVLPHGECGLTQVTPSSPTVAISPAESAVQ